MTNSKLLAHFKKADLVIYEALQKIGGVGMLTTHIPADYFLALNREIIAQQLSTKVAEVIFNRYKNLFPNQTVSAEKILKLTHDQIRAVGMSNSKVKYLQDLASKVHSGELNFDKLQVLEDEGVIEKLVSVKGIGRWTAEMFLIFALQRENVFSYGDLGLRRAFQKLYHLDHKVDLKKAEIIIAKWAPYKSYASRILWKSLDF